MMIITTEIQHFSDTAVAVIKIDNPPVNSLGSQLRVELGKALESTMGDPLIKAIVLTGTGRFFSGGADIREFNTSKTGVQPVLREIISIIENAAKPVVAAINGIALGGGLELTLGCHGRVVSKEARLGLPEVKLGVLPGAGGTQRLPRLVGVSAALDIIVGGEPLTADQALACGLVDQVAAGNLLDDACAYAASIVQGTRTPTRIDPAPLEEPVDEVVFENARKKAQRKYRGCMAPLACIECVAKSLETDLSSGLVYEAEQFSRLVNGEQSKALRHVFFAERKAGKRSAISGASLAIGKVGVVGAGTMGGGIAMSLANAGIAVVLLEQSDAALSKGWKTIEHNYAGNVKRGRFTESQAQQRLQLIERTTGYEDLADSDLIIEAAFEDMAVKKEIFTRLDSICKPDAILASNTSRLDIDEIAAVTSRKDKILGMHFFSPANVMRLLEVVKGAHTSDPVIEAVFKLAVRMDKTPVLVGVCDGFVGNRMISHYTREAYFLLEEGASPAQIDGALRSFGMAMGPLQMQDMAGLDISWAARKRQAATRSPHLRYSCVADRICEMGRFGQKTGSGFYRYEPGSRTPLPDPEIDLLIERCAQQAGITRRAISDEEIIARTIYALVNEGAKIVQDKIAQRPSDIDVVYVAGYGFPMFRGGPMFYADTVGLPAVLKTIEDFHERFGDYWSPAALLTQLAQSGGKFSDL